ncbi:MAG: class I SAM-dependent methyltransferase [Hyphomicrobiaceae bacterium]
MPSAEDSRTEAPLLAILRARIAERGPLPVDDYMHLCLADPDHGYWQQGGIIGAEGDFITAPEISQIFGELIGLWSVVAWQGMGQPSPVRLIELGPGRGTLMRDALRAARVVPGFLDAATVHLVEVSRPLREAQRQTLALPGSGVRPTLSPSPQGGEETPAMGRGRVCGWGAAAIAWHDALEEVPPGPAIIIANEFLDALPIRQLVRNGHGWRERVVEIDAHNQLRFGTGERRDVAEHACSSTPQRGDILELRPAEHALLASLAKRAAPLVALFVDYGPAESGYGDTLQAVRRHAWVDPLTDPGRVDLTAHVQFARLAHAAHAVGLATDGPMPQAEFLGRLGIAERAARLMSANPAIAAAIEAGAQRLLSPTGMGGLFKALAVRSPSLPPPPPFG